MGILLYLLFGISCVLAYENSDEFINEINSKQNLWTAGRNFHKDTPMSEITRLLGMKSLPPEILETIPVVQHKIDPNELPESFDARVQWPQCKSIKEVADQSACSSCWAISVASAISDRICIKSNGTSQPEISGKHLMTCTLMSNGCKGGTPYYAWVYWRVNGVVTGGHYGSNSGCQPYPFPPCEHHTEGSKPECPSSSYATPECLKSCVNSTMSFNNDLNYGESAYTLSHDEAQIRAEIVKRGPVVAGFAVYSDFVHYKSGVYVKTSGEFIGRHAVRIIGWGQENGTKYWLVVNSWNEDWGDKGLFKIRRGVDESGIEAELTAGLPE